MPQLIGESMIVRWIIINLITIFIIISWSFYQGYDSSYVLTGKLIAQAAFILFLINLNMYFVFLLIRKTKVRKVKIKLAQISKKMMKFHIPIAITASLLIIFHGSIMLTVQNWDPKTWSGILAILGLTVLLFSGLLRRKKATGRRRRFHYTMAFLFFFLVFLHIFI
jgi:hypothetical protein